MEHATEPEPRLGTHQGRPTVLLGVMLTVLLLAAVLTAILGPRAALVKPRTSRTISGRRWDASSPYKNTRPGVKYVGDAACTRCHAEIAETYRRHPMGRSLAPIATATARPGATSGTADPCSRPRARVLDRTIGTAGSSTQETRRIPRAESSPGTRPRSSSCSAPGGEASPT